MPSCRSRRAGGSGAWRGRRTMTIEPAVAAAARKSGMSIKCGVTQLSRIQHLRDIYRHEMHCQIMFDSLHERPGWTTPYLLTIDGAAAGYGAVAHAVPWKDKPSIFEFFVLPTQRHRTFHLFSAFVAACGTRAVETQSN